MLTEDTLRLEKLPTFWLPTPFATLRYFLTVSPITPKDENSSLINVKQMIIPLRTNFYAYTKLFYNLQNLQTENFINIHLISVVNRRRKFYKAPSLI